jgi:hypothetical protein
MDRTPREQPSGIRSWSVRKQAFFYCICVLSLVGGILVTNYIFRRAETVDAAEPKQDRASNGSISRQVESAYKNANQSPEAISTQSFFGKSVRELLRSSSISQIDYALVRIPLSCTAFVLGEPGIKLIDNQFSRTVIDRYPVGSFHFGTAQRTERIAAYQRSLKLCGELYEGKAIAQEERDRVLAGSAGREQRELSLQIRTLLMGSPSPADPQVKLALDKVFSEPMLGLATSLFLSKLDYSNLEAAYGAQVSPVAWREIVSTLLLCNLGENCSAGSALTEQLCWQNAICMPNARADDAILASLSQRGVNTAALNEFVGKTYSRIVNRDTSMFFEKNK